MIASFYKNKKILSFIAIAYGLSWTLTELYYFFEGPAAFFPLLLLVIMFMPALAAILVNRFFGETYFGKLGLTFEFSRWLIIAAFVPVLLVVISILISGIMPGAAITSGTEFIHDQLSTNVPDKDIEKVISIINSLTPVLFYSGILITGALMGSIINAIPALGEEIGWRGFLQRELTDLSFWKSSITVGVLWGIWHFPVILRGYNYPGYPVAGVFMMIILTILLSPFMYFLKIKTGSVIPAAVFHGSFNAIAALPVILIDGGHTLLTGVTGLAGMITLLILNLLVFFYRRKEKDKRNAVADTQGISNTKSE